MLLRYLWLMIRIWKMNVIIVMKKMNWLMKEVNEGKNSLMMKNWTMEMNKIWFAFARFLCERNFRENFLIVFILEELVLSIQTSISLESFWFLEPIFRSIVVTADYFWRRSTHSFDWHIVWTFKTNLAFI